MRTTRRRSTCGSPGTLPPPRCHAAIPVTAMNPATPRHLGKELLGDFERIASQRNPFDVDVDFGSGTGDGTDADPVGVGQVEPQRRGQGGSCDKGLTAAAQREPPFFRRDRRITRQNVPTQRASHHEMLSPAVVAQAGEARVCSSGDSSASSAEIRSGPMLAP